jgi:hypothetical protein
MNLTGGWVMLKKGHVCYHALVIETNTTIRSPSVWRFRKLAQKAQHKLYLAL